MTAPRTIATLTRFDRVFPGEVMPADLKSLSFAAQMALKDADPALYEVLAGRMDSGTEAALLSGTWPDVAPAAPTPEQVRAEQVALLTQLNPFAPTSRNLSAQLQLEAIDPQAAAQQRALAQPYLALEQANAATRRQQAEAARAQQAADHSRATAQAAARDRIASGVF